MEPVYRQQFYVAPTAVDRFGRLKISTLLLFGQEAAGHHSDELGYSYESLSARGLFWAVIRNRVQITRLPMEGETITLETWPMPTTRTAYPRSIVAYDEQGRELFRSVSLWVLMDLNTRGMILPGKSGVIVDGTLRGTELAAPHSLIPKPMSRQEARPVRFTDLDKNGHMNNARYLDWIADLLPSDFHREHPVRELTLCYLNEAREGQDLSVTWEPDGENTMNVEIQRPKNNGDHERIFAARVGF